MFILGVYAIVKGSITVDKLRDELAAAETKFGKGGSF